MDAFAHKHTCMITFALNCNPTILNYYSKTTPDNNISVTKHKSLILIRYI